MLLLRKAFLWPTALILVPFPSISHLKEDKKDHHSSLSRGYEFHQFRKSARRYTKFSYRAATWRTWDVAGEKGNAEEAREDRGRQAEPALRNSY